MVRGILEGVPGVKGAKVDFYASRADVVYDKAKADPGRMIEALKKGGYRGSLLSG